MTEAYLILLPPPVSFAGGSHNCDLETRHVAFVSATTEHALSMAIFGLISEAKA